MGSEQWVGGRRFRDLYASSKAARSESDKMAASVANILINLAGERSAGADKWSIVRRAETRLQ